MKDILLDFILFSGIEGFIFCLFFYKIGNCRKFKWYEWLIMSFGNCVISKVFPPMIYQILMIIWMGLFLKYFIMYSKSIFKCTKLPFCSFWMMFIVEIIFSIILEKLFNFDRFSINYVYVLKVIFPFYIIKCIEISIIKILELYKKLGVK